MGKEIKIGCGQPRKENLKEEIIKKEPVIKEEKNMIMVGTPAPIFTTQAFHEGKFKEVSLEDYKGKWVLLCFYPGDFTFV